MGIEGLPVERLRAYLRELKPEARALLVAELERGLLRGDDMPAADLILKELRPSMRPMLLEQDRVGNAPRLFFQPIEAFVVDEPTALPGRLPRASLRPFWEWICRDLLPDAAAEYCSQVNAALLAPDEATARQLARGLQDRVVQAITELLRRIEGDEKARRRVAGQIRTPRAMEELQDILRILHHRDALAQIANRLPAQIRNLADEQLENAVSMLKAAAAAHEGILPPALILVMNRLGAAWQLIRIPIRAAETDVAARVAQSPLAPAVGLVLAEVYRAISELGQALGSGQIAHCISLVKEIHNSVRALRTEMDLSGDTPWSREVAALRAQAAALLQPKIESVPARVRRLLRPPDGKDLKAGELDLADVAETNALIELVAACRNYASELAINQIALRVHADLKQYLDTSCNALLEGLKGCAGPERKFRQSQVDAAVRFAAKLFGAEYASMLAKAAVLAAGERKMMKA